MRSTDTSKVDKRLQRVLHGGLSSILQKAVGLLIAAVSLPLTVRYLGPQRYGIWVTVSTTVVMLSFIDLGVANSLTNKVAQAYANNDQSLAQKYYATAFWVSTAIALLLGMVAYLVWPHLSWGQLFKLSDPSLRGEISSCAAIALAFFLVGLPLNLVNRVLSGYQQTQITNYFGVLANLLGLGAILIVIRLHGSLVMLMAVYSATLLTGTLFLNLWVSLWDRPWLFPKPSALDRRIIRSLMSSSFGFFLLQLAGLVVFNSDNLVISHYLGASDVVPYSVTWKVAGYAGVLQTAIFPSLWPAYAEAYERGDYTWVRNTFWKGVRFGMGTVLAALVLLMIFGRPLIHWYVGPAAVPSLALLGAICFWTLMSTGMDLQACFLAAINRVRLQGALSVVAAILNLVLSIYLVKRIGSMGVILGTIISYVIALVVPQTWIVWHGMYRPPLRTEKLASINEAAVHGI